MLKKFSKKIIIKLTKLSTITSMLLSLVLSSAIGVADEGRNAVVLIENGVHDMLPKMEKSISTEERAELSDIPIDSLEKMTPESYISNGTAYIFLNSNRVLANEISLLPDKLFHTVELVMEREMTSIDNVTLNTLNEHAPHVKKLSIQFAENIENKMIPGTSLFDNLQIVWCEEIITNATFFGFGAFYNANSLKKVNLPDVTTIKDYAFYSVYSLEYLNLPNLTSLGENSFIKTPIQNIVIGLTIDNLKSLLPSDTKESIITLHLTSTDILDDRLTDFTNLEHLTSNATMLGNSVARNANSLQTVNFPQATAVGNNAFSNASKLKKVDMPNALSFGIYAFDYTNSLEIVNLPKVITFEYGAFNNTGRDGYFKELALPSLMSLGYNSFTNARIGVLDISNAVNVWAISSPNISFVKFNKEAPHSVMDLVDSPNTIGILQGALPEKHEISDKGFTLTQGTYLTNTNKLDKTSWGANLTNEKNILSSFGDLFFTNISKDDSGEYNVSLWNENAEGHERISVYWNTLNLVNVNFEGAPVTIYHVDEDNQNLLEPEILTGNLDTEFKTSPKTFERHRLKSMPDNASGRFTSEAQTVTYRYETLPTPEAPHVNTVSDKDTMITGTGVVGATIKVMSESQTLAVSQVGADGTYALTIVQQAAGTVLSVTQTLDGMESPSTSITVSKTEEVYTTQNEFKLGYWQSYGLILEGQLTNESWDFSSRVGLQGTIQLVNENGTVERSAPMAMTNWYDETQYNGYQAILDESMVATLSSGLYEIRIIVSKNGSEVANESIHLPTRSTLLGLLMNFTSDFMRLPSNHIGSSFLEMKNKNQRAHIQIDNQENTPIMGLISEAIIEEGRAINGFILNTPFDFSQEHQKNLIIETKAGEEVAVIEHVHTWDLSNWGLRVTNLDVHSGFQSLIPNEYTNTSLYQYKMTITAPRELETEYMRILLDKII